MYPNLLYVWPATVSVPENVQLEMFILDEFCSLLMSQFEGMVNADC